MDGAFPPIFHQFLYFLFITGRSGCFTDLLSIYPEHCSEIIPTAYWAGMLGGLTVIVAGGHQKEVGVTDGVPGNQPLPELAEHMPTGPLVTDLISIIHHMGKCRRGVGR